MLGLVGVANGLFALNDGAGEWFCGCGVWFHSMGNLGIGGVVPIVNRWKELVRSLVVTLHASCSFFNSSQTQHASLSSSLALSI